MKIFIFESTNLFKKLTFNVYGNYGPDTLGHELRKEGDSSKKFSSNSFKWNKKKLMKFTSGTIS